MAEKESMASGRRGAKRASGSNAYRHAEHDRDFRVDLKALAQVDLQASKVCHVDHAAHA